MPWRPVTITTTIGKLASYNPRRRSLSVENNGTAVVYFSQDPSNVAAAGFPLAVGQAVTLIREDGDEPELDLYGVASAGSQDMRVQEGVGAPVPLPVHETPS